MSPQPRGGGRRSTPARKLTKRQQQTRDQRNAALRKTVRKYLGAAGISVEALQEGVEVQGKVVLFTGADRRAVDEDRVVDRVVGEAGLDLLLASAVRELGGHGLPYRALGRDGAVRLYDSHHAVAVIRVTTATVSGHGRTVRGNFLVPGDHWDILRLWLGSSNATRKAGTGARPPATPPAVPAPARVITRFPDSTPPELRLSAIKASQLLRHERTVEFGHTVLLRFAGGSLRFWPIPDTGAARVPFVYERDGDKMEGALRLKAPNDPMAVEVEGDPAPDLLAQGWGEALIGYSELTCVAGPEPVMPDQFEPTSQTRKLLASYVVGHARRLPEGHSPSSLARTHAERIGVTLTPRQTWVRPHTRGVPLDAELVFHWSNRQSRHE